MYINVNYSMKLLKARGGKRKVITETLGFLMGIHERRKEDKDTNGPIILGVL